MYTPPGYNASDAYPLLIVLHGQGGMGDNLNLLLNKDDIPSKLIHENRWPSRYPFIVVSPQLKRDPSVPDPADQLWPPEMVEEVVQHVRSRYAVNANKIYITGLSQGAHGSYDYATAFPSRIAAAVLISGVPDSTKACLVKDIPFWVMHGSDDSLVPLVFAKGLVRNLEACSPPGRFRPHFNMLYGRRHEGWNEVYNNSNGFNIYDWMLKFTKNNSSNTAPYANAGADLTIATRQQPLHLYGEYFDSDGEIINVQWTKVSGPTITMAGTSSRFLKLTDLTTGVFEFELTVTDDDGALARDRVRINIVSGNSSPAVTGLTLLDGSNKVMASLYDGYVIHPKSVRRNEINIRANVTGAVGSVRFIVNSNQNARTAQAPYSLASPRWTLEEGEYLICATPYTGANGTGTEGTSQCFKIVYSADATPPPPPPDEEPPVEEPPVEEPPVEEPPVEQPPATHFYSKAGADISLLTSWSSNANGTGTAPTSFNAAGQTFEVRTEAVLNNALAIGGEGSTFKIVAGGKLTLNNTLQAPVNMHGPAALYIASGHPVTFGTVEPQSTVYFNSDATIPAAVYGNLILHGSGTVKNLQPGTTTVTGALTVSEGVRLEGSAATASTLILSGDIQLLTTGSFAPTQPFAVVFKKTGVQKLSVSATHLVLHSATVQTGTILDIKAAEKMLLETGSASGGGLSIESGGKLLLHNNDLFIAGAGTLNAGNQTGEIGFSQSTLTLTSSAATNSYLYTATGSDTVRALSVNATSTGKLILQRPLFVSDYVRPVNGVTDSNGFLSLVSTASHTAFVAQSEGTGIVEGEVGFQRFIPRGKAERYLSLPVTDVSVQDLQKFVTVRGNFIGAAPGTPSLHQYNESQGGWVPYPITSNIETLQPGKGYWLSSLNTNQDTKLVVAGKLQQGEFSYSLSANPGNDPAKGWNLIGNPYAAPIDWSGLGWTLDGVGPAAYVLDDRYPGGRFLVWDGEVGDVEFAGILASGQGFFVRTIGDNAVLRVNEEAKTDSASTLWRQKSTKTHSGLIAVALKQNQLIDRTYMKFSRDGDNMFDPSDAVKRRNGYFSVYTLSQDAISLAINHLGESFCDRSIVLVADAPPGQYSFVFDSLGLNDTDVIVNLFDQFTGDVISIKENSVHHFQITADPASGARDRFLIQMPTGSLNPVITPGENLLTSNLSSGNQWLLNGVPIEGATGQTLVPDVSGEYTLVVTSNGCTKTSDPVYFTVTVTAVGEKHPARMDVYPNPASEMLNVTLHPAATGKVSYTITNSIGIAAATGGWSSTLGVANGFQIDVSKLASGVYFLSIQAPDWTERVRFVVH